MRLGRRYPTAAHRRRALPLAPYLRRALPAAPLELDHATGVDYRLFGNDRYGDCTVAALANWHLTAAAREGRPLSFSDSDVIAWYFDASDGHDDGLYEVDVLARAQAFGFPLDGAHRLAAWVRIDCQDLDSLRSCASLFHAVYVGARLPISAKVLGAWDAVSDTGDDAPGSWGGHAMLCSRYDQLGPTFATWGRLQRATWAWWRLYVDEAYALLDAERAQAAGVDWAALLADLQAIKE